MKILTILGARPQFIKAASVSREIAKYQEIMEVIIHTGQHYDSNMSDIFFDELKIPLPKYNLKIREHGHGAMTGRMISEIEKVSLIENPDWIIVYGDTNSTLAGAIVASKLGIKLAHIEAGLRSFNMNMPEEINRVITDRVSNLLLCPSDKAVINLNNEGFTKVDCKYLNVGNVMLDAAMYFKQFSKKPFFKINNDFILCTIHRAENTNNIKRLKDIMTSINDIAHDVQVVLPMHPRTLKIIQDLKVDFNNISVVNPLGYLEMIWMVDNCHFVMTDSGGLQAESYFFGKKCIIFREDAEFTELIDIGANILVGADRQIILKTYNEMLMNNIINFNSEIFGNGNASNKIVSEIINF